MNNLIYLPSISIFIDMEDGMVYHELNGKPDTREYMERLITTIDFNDEFSPHISNEDYKTYQKLLNLELDK
jgi:hypothetical protein